MKVEIKNPIPLYRKLLLENKILLFFLSILLLLGLTVLAATYRTSTRLADDLILEQAQAVLGLYKNRFEKEIIDSLDSSLRGFSNIKGVSNHQGVPFLIDLHHLPGRPGLLFPVIAAAGESRHENEHHKA